MGTLPRAATGRGWDRGSLQPRAQRRPKSSRFQLHCSLGRPGRIQPSPVPGALGVSRRNVAPGWAAGTGPVPVNPAPSPPGRLRVRLPACAGARTTERPLPASFPSTYSGGNPRREAGPAPRPPAGAAAPSSRGPCRVPPLRRSGAFISRIFNGVELVEPRGFVGSRGAVKRVRENR